MRFDRLGTETTQPLRSLIRKGLLLAIPALIAGGCASNSTSYGWTHAQGGEYLFAFDERECGEALPAVEKSDPEGRFFSCMRQRGYLQIDLATGMVIAANQPGLAEVAEENPRSAAR